MWLLSGIKCFGVFGSSSSSQGGHHDQTVGQRAAHAWLFVFSLVAVCVGETKIKLGVVGLDGSLAEAAEKLVLRGEIEAMRKHVKFGEGRSAGDCLPVPLHFSDEERELRELRVIPQLLVEEIFMETVHPARENDNRKGRRRASH